MLMTLEEGGGGMYSEVYVFCIPSYLHFSFSVAYFVTA